MWLGRTGPGDVVETEQHKRMTKKEVEEMRENKVRYALIVVSLRVRVVPHGPRLRVVVGRIGVQVAEVLGRVFADTEVPDGDALLAVHLRPRHVEVVHVLVLVISSLDVFFLKFYIIISNKPNLNNLATGSIP